MANTKWHCHCRESRREKVVSWVTCRILSNDWIEQGLMSPPTQYRLSGRQFYRWKDPTNSIKVLKEKLASHRPEEAPNPQGASHRVTSEPLKKEKPYHSGSSPGRQSPTQQADLYKSCIDRATIDIVMQQQRLHNTSVRQDLRYCTLFAPSQHQWWNVAKV